MQHLQDATYPSNPGSHDLLTCMKRLHFSSHPEEETFLQRYKMFIKMRGYEYPHKGILIAVYKIFDAN